MKQILFNTDMVRAILDHSRTRSTYIRLDSVYVERKRTLGDSDLERKSMAEISSMHNRHAG